MIDPPDGWRYGFPKPFTPSPGQSIEEWLIQNGYPEHQVSSWPGGLQCRIWSTDARTSGHPSERTNAADE